MNHIHPTAIIAKKAVLGKDVVIGPYCVIEDNVIIGDYVTLKSHVHLCGTTKIGDHSSVYSFATIGSPPQDLKYSGEDSFLDIGEHVVIREYTMINGGTHLGGGITKVGNDCVFLAHTHVGHDSIIGNHCVFSHAVILGGHTRIRDYAVLGGCVAVHQFCTIGAYAFITGFSAVSNDIPPYGLAGGRAPNFLLSGINAVGLKRNNFTKKSMHIIRRAYRILFGESGPLFKKRIKLLKELYPNEKLVEDIIDFCNDECRKRTLPVGFRRGWGGGGGANHFASAEKITEIEKID